MLKEPITLEQPVFLPGNERCGIWASPLLETVIGPDRKWGAGAGQSLDSQMSVRGDLELALFAAGELRRI